MKRSDININKLYDYINKYINNNGYPPSIREMAKELNIKSTSTISYYLNKLEKSNKIKRNPSKNRTISIVKPEKIEHKYENQEFSSNFNLSEFPVSETIQVPVIGEITAGEPIFAREEHDDYMTIPKDMFKDENIFVLKVKGDSMINAGIHHSDKIIVRKQNTANNGQIVVAIIGEEATVKRYYKEKNHFRLQPENDSMDPIITENVEILGKVIGLIRNMD